MKLNQNLNNRTTKVLSITLIALFVVMLWQTQTIQVAALPGPEDSYEENDFIGQPVNIGMGTYNLTLGDEDWFYVSMDTNETLNITIEFDGTACDMDLELYDTSNSLITWSNYSNFVVYAKEEISYLVPSFGNYVFRIFTLGTYSNETYLLTVTNGTAAPADDSFEENDLIGSASIISPGFYSNLIQMDEDYYQFYANIGDQIIIDVDYDEWIENLSVSLYEPAPSYGFLTAGVFNYSFGGISINYTTSFSGDYTLGISGLNAGMNYSISLIVISPPLIDDSYEDNDDYASASPISQGFYNDLIQLDEDYYQFSAYPGDQIFIDVDYDEWVDNLSVTLYGPAPNYTYLGEGFYNDAFGGKSLVSNATLNGSYYLEVGGTNAGMNYTIDLKIIPPPIVADDIYEENDLQNESAYLTMDRDYFDLILADDDWYLFDVDFTQYCTVYIDIMLNTSTSNIHAEIFDETGHSVINLTLDYDYLWGNLDDFAIGSGVYYLWIQPLGFESIGYNLSIYSANTNCEGPQCEVDDYLEENDDPMQAKLISPQLYSNLILCDSDFYRLNVNNNDTVEITISWTNHSANLFMGLMLWSPISYSWEPIMLEPYQVSSQPGMFKIMWTANYTGDLIILVDHVEFDSYGNPILVMGEAVPYSLDIVINGDNNNDSTTNNTSSEDDGGSPNDLTNPFGSIPGYPVESILGVGFISMLALLFINRKRR